MCVYVGYPKGISKDCFGSHKEDKMFVMYKYKVLDDDYVNNLKELFQKISQNFCKTTIKYIQK